MSAPTVGMYRLTLWLASDRKRLAPNPKEGPPRATRRVLLCMKEMCADRPDHDEAPLGCCGARSGGGGVSLGYPFHPSLVWVR